MYDLSIKNGLVYLDGAFEKRNIYIKGDTIERITDENLKSLSTHDARGNMVMPGIIDPHVHFGLDLGFARARDDFEAGTRAAVHGGVTTVIDFLDPVDNPGALRQAFKKRYEAAKDAHIDYKFHATIKHPDCDLEDFVLTMKSLGMDTLKLFTTYSDSGRRTNDEDIIRLLRLSDKHDFLLLVHIESDGMITLDDAFTHEDLPISRPRESETVEALKLASFVDIHGGSLYMVHLSSGETLRQLKKTYPHLLNRRFIIESCPQYFTFDLEKLRQEDGHLFTFAPPLRIEAEKKLLRSMIDDIATIGTDHCAFHKADKQKPRLKDIPLGIGGVEQSFDIMYHRFGATIIDKMTRNVARIHRIDRRRGTLAPGKRADIFIYQKERRLLKHHHGDADHNLYMGLEVSGKVTATIKGGRFLLKDGVFTPGEGRMINNEDNQGDY